jgi:hypothetical protein
MIRTGLNLRLFGANYPMVMGLLLVLSGIFSTMEFVNAIWWSSLAGYTWGVLWLLALTGVQLIAFVCYDVFSPPIAEYQTLAPADAARSSAYGVRRDSGTGDPNSKTDYHTNDYRTGNLGTGDSYRYRDERQVNAYRRSLSDSTVRLSPTSPQRQHSNGDSRP